MKENRLHPVRLAVVMLGASCCSALLQPKLGVESGAHLQLRPSRLGAASTSILLHRISSRAEECAVEVRLGFMYDRITGSVNFFLCVWLPVCPSCFCFSSSFARERANTFESCRPVPFLIFDVFYLWFVCVCAHSCGFARVCAQDVAPIEALRGGGLAKKLGLKNIGMLMVLLRYQTENDVVVKQH
jgi:hypothetical protein